MKKMNQVNPRRSKRHMEILLELERRYPSLKVEEEFHIGENLMIDIYVPSLFLAIEVDGEQHDKFNPFFHNNNVLFFNKQKKRDRRKEYLCKLKDINLFRVKSFDKRSPEEILSEILKGK